MAKQKTKPSVRFQLKKISTEQFALVPEAYDSSVDEFQMGIGLRFGVNADNRSLATFVEVRYKQKSDAPFLILEVAAYFQIDEEAWEEFQHGTAEMVIPKGFAAHLVMLTIGTLRGVLHCKTENTEFNTLLLPTINVTEMIKEDVVLQVDEI